MSIEELAEKAIDFIVDKEKDDCHICEVLCDDWCETHCQYLVRKECVVEYLTNYYEK
jgi:hypothetical protein